MAHTLFMYELSQLQNLNCSCADFSGCEFYELRFNLKPITTNAERAGNRFVRADFTKHWRQLGFLVARQLPKAQWLIVIAEPHQEKGRLQDVGACNPSVKAVVDGIVDAKIIPDDSADYVKEVRFLPPVRKKNGLTIKLVLKPLNT